jgi:hypothetical protein
MTTSYDRRQTAGHWPRRGRWNPAELPGWYLELLGQIVDASTAWQTDHDPNEWRDPRHDPRRPTGCIEERSRHACE